jgi:hypothetical protein
VIFFRLDECVAYKIAVAAKEVGIPQDVKFEAPQTESQTGVQDIAWMKLFAERGSKSDKRVVFTSDGMIKHREAERAAAITAGLIVFYAPRAAFWRPLKKRGQAAYFLRWFDRMVETARAAQAGDQFQLPASFSAGSTLKPLGSVIKPVKTRKPSTRKPRTSGSRLL